MYIILVKGVTDILIFKEILFYKYWETFPYNIKCFLIFKSEWSRLGIMVQALTPATQEVEVEGSWSQASLGQKCETIDEK
jgi:hypothetical protein